MNMKDINNTQDGVDEKPTPSVQEIRKVYEGGRHEEEPDVPQSKEVEEPEEKEIKETADVKDEIQEDEKVQEAHEKTEDREKDTEKEENGKVAGKDEEKQKTDGESRKGVEKGANDEDKGKDKPSSEDKEDENVDEDYKRRVIKQMEYYFGDINLPRDIYMSKLLQKHNGWIPLNMFIRFNQIKKICKNQQGLLDGLKGYDNDLLEIDFDREMIRRSPDIPIKERHPTHQTIYVINFPKEVDFKEIGDFMEEQGYPVEAVFNVRDPKTKKPTDVVKIELETITRAKKLRKANITYKDCKLEFLTYDEYLTKNPKRV